MPEQVTFTPIRKFARTGITLCVEERWREGRDWPEFFVAQMAHDEQPQTHCGPYSTREQAEDWIMAIREGEPTPAPARQEPPA